jgi:transcriptional regulator with XRE-family HTH domain
MTPKEMRKRRSKLGLTQTQVALKVGVSVPAYRLWESGGTKPNQENAKKLESVLKIPGTK